jgi:catechol 2,3-dioxygenase-like lactoylglutathione lyase family enzyme
MLKDSKVFSSFSVKDIDAAEKFYGETLELDVERQPEGLALKLKGDHDVFIYPKQDHQAATFTVLNFIVDDLEKTVDLLSDKGIAFEQYNYADFRTDEKGIFRSDRGPRMIAWFKDPDGNFLSILQQH